MTLPRWQVPITALLIAGAILFLIGKWSGKAGAEDAGIIQSAQTALSLGKALRLHLEKFRIVSQAQADSARKWKQVAVVRGAVITAQDTALSRSTTERDSLRIVLIQRDTLKAQVTLWEAIAHRWELADRADSSRAALSEARNTILEANLRATLTVGDCHIGGLSWLPRCPSRTTSALLGLTVGVLGTLVLHR